MKNFAVSVPIAGFIYIEVEAENEEEAKQKAFESDAGVRDIEEWDMHEKIVEGNIFHGSLNEIEIEEI